MNDSSTSSGGTPATTDKGSVVAAAFVAGVRRDGLTPDPALRLLGHRSSSTPASPVPIVDGPDTLGVLCEQLTSSDERIRRGVWFTPRWLADELVGRIPPTASTLVDPACGAGVFLLAAADRLAGTRPPDAVVASLWGADIDPLAIAVAEASLWWWSARAGCPVVAGDRLVVGDVLAGTPIPVADAVVGNPPFLGQLRQATAATPDRRRALRTRFGAAVRAYTDEAWLFLLVATETLTPGGHAVLVQPRSLLGARDAGPVRDAVDARCRLVDTWIGDGGEFDAAVDVCAPVLVRRTGPEDAGGSELGGSNDWGGSLARALSVPEVDLDPTSVLGDRVEVIAGFRDEYYGLVGAVHEGGHGPRLVTSGAVDPFRCRADVPVRFAKRRWSAPAVDVAAVTGRARRWLDAQAGAKLIIATQTKVVEAVVDTEGDMVAGVPAIVVRPHDPAEVWKLAAALHAPVVSAWMLRRSAGTALSSDACKPTAALVAQVPLPTDRAAVAEASALARRIAAGDDESWAEFGSIANRAYGVEDPEILAWWLRRLPLR